MKLDTHNFNSSHQSEDLLEVSKEILGKDPARFSAIEKTLDSSKNEVGNHDGFWQVSGFDSYNSVYRDIAESNGTKFKDDGALNCHVCENFGQIDEMHQFSSRSKNELEVPELVICYKENSYLDIKDICVDENMPSCERMLFETDVRKEDLCTLLLLEKGRSNQIMTETTEVSDPTPDYLKFSEDQDGPDSQVYSEEIRQTEVKVHDVADYSPICQMLSKEDESAKEIPQERPSSGCACNGNTEMPLKELVMEAISSNPASTPDDEESVSIPHAEESNNNTDLTHPEGEIPRSPSEESNHSTSGGRSSNGNDQVDSAGNGNQESLFPDQNISKVHDSQEGSFRDQDILGEASFSMAGPISGLITYSGPIAYSGSLSLRSDSTTSTRSFAFPVLQSEWHSSPVRMAKADKRRFRKHGGWRQGLLCCRF